MTFPHLRFLGQALPSTRSWLSLAVIVVGAILYVVTDDGFQVPNCVPPKSVLIDPHTPNYISRVFQGHGLHVGGPLLRVHHGGDGVRQVCRGLGGDDDLGPRVSSLVRVTHFVGFAPS